MSIFIHTAASMKTYFLRFNKYRAKVLDKPTTRFKKLHVIIILLLVLSCHTVFAQRERIDSLKKILPSLHDSARVDCLNELSGIYIKFIRDTLGYCDVVLAETYTWPSFSIEASRYASIAYNEATKINYIHGIAESLSYKGETEEFSGKFLSEEKLCRDAIYWYRKSPNKRRLSETYSNLGLSLYAQSSFGEAIKILDTAYEWHERNGNITGMYWALSVSDAVYHESGNYEKAFELARKSLDISIKINNDWFKRQALAKIGWLFLDIGDYNTALEYYRGVSKNVKLEAFDFAKLFTLQHQYDSAKYYYNLIDTSYQGVLRFYLVGIGNYYFAQEQYEKALPNFLRGLHYHQQLNDVNQVMSTLLYIAKTYLALGNNDSAFEYGHESLSIAKQSGAKQIIRDASEILSSVYDHWHQSDSAYFYYRLYTGMKDSVLNNVIKGKLAAYTFEQKIELLNKEREIQKMQLQKQSLFKNVLIGSIIVLLLLASIVIRIIILKRKNEKQSLEHKLQLQQLESKIESQQALLNERSRISRELHDDIGGTLSGIVLYSHLAENQIQAQHTDEVEQSLNVIQQSANDMVNRLNDIVWSVSPEHNSLKNLMQKLEEYALEMATVKNIKVQMNVPEGLAELQLPLETLHNIYLLCKEAINNAVKYSEASLLQLCAHHSDHVIEFTISDNGKGFDMATVKKGNGLMNMQKRADEISAKLCVKSVPLQGTFISLQCSIEIPEHKIT